MEAKDREKLLEKMTAVADKTYWLFFWMGMGSECHAFIEFNGVIAKYVEMCRKAHKAGIDFTQSNRHTGATFPVEDHDMRYLGEKLGCVFAPAFRDNPEAKAAFLEALEGEI